MPTVTHRSGRQSPTGPRRSKRCKSYVDHGWQNRSAAFACKAAQLPQPERHANGPLAVVARFAKVHDLSILADSIVGCSAANYFFVGHFA